MAQHLMNIKRQHGNELKPSLVITVIDIDLTPTWTTYETHSPDLKRVSSVDWEGDKLGASGRERTRKRTWENERVNGGVV